MIPIEMHNEILAGLRSNKSIKKVLLFGSYARGIPGPESDIDIVVITDSQGVHTTYAQMQEDRNKISSLLIETRKRVPMDIVVYTDKEWQLVHNDPSDFIRTIDREAIQLL